MPARTHVNVRRSSPAPVQKEFGGRSFAQGHRDMLVQQAIDAVSKVSLILHEPAHADLVRAVQSANAKLRDAAAGPRIDGRPVLDHAPQLTTVPTIADVEAVRAMLDAAARR